ncbi:CGNR zinc finger domain-containing protein [Cellulomonas endophytica]|uniref:CGNR zinc finger domain-containing protein n=1 Tax=Cellulomonas endophytica TaxID=2494735 RepID=UPI00101329CE|nr:CGNR zinc finger domain-containing protein [Cellulomonas endophytica]
MSFAPDTRVALQAAAALVNTAGDRRRDGVDRLVDVDDLDRFYAANGFAGRHDRDAAELAAVRGVRDRVRRLWDVPRDEAAGLVNAMLLEADARPWLVRHDGWDWHLHATPMDAPLPVRILTEAAMAVVDVVRSGEYDRMRVCGAPGCSAVLVDLSRNRSRRFCDVNNCANRLHVQAFRERRSRAADAHGAPASTSTDVAPGAGADG